MAYNISIYLYEGEERGYVFIGDPLYCRPSYNVHELLTRSMNWDFEEDKIYNCAEIMHHIERGIRELKENPREYQRYQPSNGWGDIEDTLNTLINLKNTIYNYIEDLNTRSDDKEGINALTWGDTEEKDLSPEETSYLTWVDVGEKEITLKDIGMTW